jgi:hypothetical protein
MRRLALLTLLALCGCQLTNNLLPSQGYSSGLRGILYYHNTVPLDTHFAGTPVYKTRIAEGEGDVKQVSVHYFPIYVDIVWDSNAIGDIARAQGIDEIYYADMETLSVVFGIWSQRTVHIYGKPAPATK